MVSAARLRMFRRVVVLSGGLREGSCLVGMWGDNGRIIDGRIIFLEKTGKDFDSEQDAPTTAWGETPKLRCADQWLDSFARFVIFC